MTDSSNQRTYIKYILLCTNKQGTCRIFYWKYM